MSWTLDPRLEASSLPVCDLALCHVRLQDDARWPWLVLIPRRAGCVELEDLPPADRARLMEEAVSAGGAVRAVAAAAGRPVDKLNVGALGNVVAQLHVHVVGRRRVHDPAELRPVWGVGVAEPWPEEMRAAVVAAARAGLA